MRALTPTVTQTVPPTVPPNWPDQADLLSCDCGNRSGPLSRLLSERSLGPVFQPIVALSGPCCRRSAWRPRPGAWLI